jgi:branched-chain amino acid transport system substrate-binding protein
MRKLVSVFLVVALVATVLGFFGCAKKAEEIKIGAILPLTGSQGKYGENAKKGIDLAVKEENSRNGVNGKKIRIIYEDSQSSPRQAVAAARKLIAVDHVPVIIGEMASSLTIAIAPVAEQNHVVLISPSSSNPDITHAGEYIFRNCVSDVHEGSYVVRVARDLLGLKKVAVLYINNDYGEGLKRIFVQEFEKSGHHVVTTQKFEPNATDFRPQLAKIKKSRPEGLFLVGHKEMILALRQFKELNLKYQIISTVMFDDPEILEKAGDAAEGTVFTTWRLDLKRKEAQEFLNSFKSEYGTEPGIFAPEAYDALKIVASAIESGGYSADGIKNALYEIREYPGATGETSFDENGDVMKPLVLEVVRNGEFERFVSQLNK